MRSENTLALFGGEKAIKLAFDRYNPIGEAELAAAKRVIESGVLSKFLGCWDVDFYGGPEVQRFERECEAYFGVKHAVTVNSLTSGLIAAVGAIGIEPGDEVIVSPWTMSASATAILHWNAIPIFADIDPDTFCLDPASVEANITPYTKAIIAVDIFGHPADTDALSEIAARHGLKIISDAAQAPGALFHGNFAGTLTDVGGFSLNYHKHIHTGEGGIMVTNDDRIAERMQLIRNHAEAVVGDKGTADLDNMVGYNFRLGEIEAAIGVEQLGKLKGLVTGRQQAAENLKRELESLPGLQLPVVKPDCTHAYYIFAMEIDRAATGVGRSQIAAALRAEGVPGLLTAYQNLHLLPLYQRKTAYGSHGFPWTSDVCRRVVDYQKGICPVAENLQDSTFLGLAIGTFDLTNTEAKAIGFAFRKVWDNLGTLAEHAGKDAA